MAKIGYGSFLLELLPFGDAKTLHDGKSPQQAWEECKCADTMLWTCGKMVGKPGWPTHKQIISTMIKCARLSLHFIHDGEERPRLAIEAAEAWVENPTEENRIKAADAFKANYVAWNEACAAHDYAIAAATDSCGYPADACANPEHVAILAGHTSNAHAAAATYAKAYADNGASDTATYVKVNKTISDDIKKEAVWIAAQIEICNIIRDTLTPDALIGEA